MLNLLSSRRRPYPPFVVGTYSGNGTSQTIDAGIPIGLLIIKNRDATQNFTMHNPTRGATKFVQPNINNAEQTDSTVVSAFTSTGFTVGSSAKSNSSGVDYVYYAWIADETGYTGEKYSLLSGVSVTVYTGNGANRTLNHSLGEVPRSVWIKNLSDGDAWRCYHASSGASYAYNIASSGARFSSSSFRSTTPTATEIYIDSGDNVNRSGETYLMIAFSENDLTTNRIRRYVGTGVDPGPLSNDVKENGLIIIKRRAATGPFYMYDVVRDTVNPNNNILQLDDGVAETTGYDIDLASGRFTVRTTNAALNNSGETYDYWMFGLETA